MTAAYFDDDYGVGDPKVVWRMLVRYGRRYKGSLALLALFAMVTATCDTLLPWLTGRVVDVVQERGAGAELAGLAIAYGATVLALAGSIGSFIWVGGRIRTYVSHDIREDGFANLQRLSFSFYDRRPVGWLMARMTSDCERLSNMLTWGTLDLAWGSTLMTGFAAVMLWQNPRLAAIVFTVVPVLGAASVYFQKRILKSSRLVRKTNSRLVAAYNEGIMGVRTSKVFVREEENLGEFRDVSGQMYRASVRNALYNAFYLPIVLSLGAVGVGLALGAGGMELLGGGITAGTLVMFLLYTRHMFEPVREMAQWFAEFQMARASAERILGLIDAEPEIRDAPEVVAALARTHPPGRAPDGGPDRIGVIEFRHVGFAYAQGETVLRDFNLRVDAGETVALVGSTGGGKSTIVSLLCRFYEPTAGEILLDGVDYRKRSLLWLQGKLGIVLQTPHLFSGTIAENIRYGRLDATDAEVEEAARLAGAHDFVANLEDGYASQVGEGGGRLSTGEKQLVSFARAILARPEILVMDEATSSVDTETEQRIQKGLAHVLGGRTSFVIAHRLSTIRAADRILVIEHGEIREEGPHRALLRRKGRYHDLYVGQSLAGAWER